MAVETVSRTATPRVRLGPKQNTSRSLKVKGARQGRPGEEESQAAADRKFMRLALREALRGEAEGEVPVGAVLVFGEHAVARAHNRPVALRDPAGHAEVLALRRAARKLGNYRLGREYTLYATIEPCAMCAGAIVQARIGRLVFGAEDPKAGAAGSALKVLNHRKLNHKVSVTRRILAAECAAMLHDFFAQRRRRLT
ncbi:MAG: tRNA adenosine(34) deaminase TadA [Terriglobia bacterium]